MATFESYPRVRKHTLHSLVLAQCLGKIDLKHKEESFLEKQQKTKHKAQ